MENVTSFPLAQNEFFLTVIDGGVEHTFSVPLASLLVILEQPFNDFIEQANPVIKSAIKGAANLGFGQMGMSKPRGIDTFDYLKALIFSASAEKLVTDGVVLIGKRVVGHGKSSD